MHGSKQVALQHRRGVSLSGLIFVLAILGLLAVFAVKIVPTYTNTGRSRIRSSRPRRPAARRSKCSCAFDANATINYISSITGKDLVISKENGETEVSFAYEKKIPLFGTGQPADRLCRHDRQERRRRAGEGRQ